MKQCDKCLKTIHDNGLHSCVPTKDPYVMQVRNADYIASIIFARYEQRGVK